MFNIIWNKVPWDDIVITVGATTQCTILYNYVAEF